MIQKEAVLKILDPKMIKFKTGIGYDAHPFVIGKPLIIGGIAIPYKYGLGGHSDADVLIHAIIDSLLGAGANTDIGCVFPDSNDEYKNIDSAVMLDKTAKIIKNKNYGISNIDTVIIAEEPKFSPFFKDMRKKLSTILGISSDDISIKATTTETMGFTGRKEGIACISVALLER